MKERGMPFWGIGAASIVLVLTIVCLSVFSVLTLSSANGDYTLSKKSLEHMTRYYEAENKADEMAGRIDQILWKQYRRSANKKDYLKKAETSLSTINGISYHKNDNTIEFKQKIAKNQQISICLKICYPKKQGDTCYEVIKWKNEALGNWKKDDSLPVFQNK